MSDLWNSASAAAAARISTLVPPSDNPVFTPWAHAFGVAPGDVADLTDAAAATIDPGAIKAEAYAAGFAEGQRLAIEELEAERQALRELAQSLAALEPEPHHELAALLAETVERLVRQTVGEVQLDEAILNERVERAAMLVVEESSPSRMRLNPEDHARLEGADLVVELVADPLLAPGTVLLETGEGWIEDGPEVGLEKLRIALDRMGVAR